MNNMFKDALKGVKGLMMPIRHDQEKLEEEFVKKPPPKKSKRGKRDAAARERYRVRNHKPKTPPLSQWPRIKK